jgi:predicted amidohydrolase YtcJ
VIASMQPTHCTSDMPWAPARLGAARVEGAYAARRLLDAGARLAFGSDFPVESDDPRFGLYAAVTTQAPDGTPPGGFRPSEGRLDPGSRADITIWDRDLTAVPAQELLHAKCVMTVVDGR